MLGSMRYMLLDSVSPFGADRMGCIRCVARVDHSLGYYTFMEMGLQLSDVSTRSPTLSVLGTTLLL
jgi:hypothetical protein